MRPRSIPTSLQAQAEERANQDHTRRLAEIRAMAPLLARLDAFVPALRERGLEVYPTGVQLHTEYRDGKQQRVLRIDTSGILDSRKPGRWLEALLALGFTEVSRTTGVVPQAVLRHRHLLLKVDVPESAAHRAAWATEFAQRAVAAAAADPNAVVTA